ncbi:MAG: hypothetical protein LBS35_08400 [Synergistaceae bacterium]|jgi:hypothetical protein|nr:hypothetical protein [Synergistaceae bacterium]
MQFIPLSESSNVSVFDTPFAAAAVFVAAAETLRPTQQLILDVVWNTKSA